MKKQRRFEYWLIIIIKFVLIADFLIETDTANSKEKQFLRNQLAVILKKTNIKREEKRTWQCVNSV